MVLHNANTGSLPESASSNLLRSWLGTTSLTNSRWKIARWALISRVLVLTGMVLSNKFIPTFNPGHDVLRFDLRLAPTELGEKRSQCFCLEGHTCDPMVGAMSMKETSRQRANKAAACSVPFPTESYRDRLPNLDTIYDTILTPLTRWDAARFLTLAVDPMARRPRDRASSSKWYTRNHVSEQTFDSSEQAHAFLPLWPLLIRHASSILLQVFAPTILPSTFEGVAALSALVLNILFCIAAALCLHDVTYTLIGYCSATRPIRTDRLIMAELAAILFCCNPAGVFFSAAYSEATFALLTFTGHALAARGWMFPAIIPWMLASYTRSNGSFSSIWLIILGCERIAAEVVDWLTSPPELVRERILVVLKCLVVLIQYVALATAVAVPIGYHDRQGYEYHCHNGASEGPSWCANSTGFSLYGHVQRKHWNVGFLRYYELKQIPNFLLATPVLVIGVMAVIDWIRFSWAQYQGNQRQDSKPRTPRELMLWSVVALSTSHLLRLSGNSKEEPHESKRMERPGSRVDHYKVAVLLGPGMLAHYAILGGFCFIGLTVAHVQVSTRLICSSCPAFYWYASYIVLCAESPKERVKQRAIILYFLLFNVIGVVMHVNFLPWT